MANSEMWTDLVEPVELTGFARARLEDYERAQNGSLTAYLPNDFLNDIEAKFEVGGTGLQPVAEYRSYDAETPLGSLPGAQRVTVELPPLGMKMKVSEYDQLRARGNLKNVLLRPSVDRITVRLVDAISDRLEYERGYAIENASLLIDDETGFKQTGDWERDASMEVDASTGTGEYWNDHAGSDAIRDLLDWQDLYIATNGFPPGSILTSTKVYGHLQRSAALRVLASSLSGAPAILSQEAVNGVLASYGLPPVKTYDRQVNFRGTVQKVLEDSFLFLLPAPAGGTIGGQKLGATYWGTTLEAGEPEYGIAELDRPGIVVGTWKSRDPIGLWVHSAAIGLPVLGNANLAMRAQVLPEGS